VKCVTGSFTLKVERQYMSKRHDAFEVKAMGSKNGCIHLLAAFDLVVS